MYISKLVFENLFQNNIFLWFSGRSSPRSLWKYEECAVWWNMCTYSPLPNVTYIFTEWRGINILIKQTNICHNNRHFLWCVGGTCLITNTVLGGSGSQKHPGVLFLKWNLCTKWHKKAYILPCTPKLYYGQCLALWPLMKAQKMPENIDHLWKLAGIHFVPFLPSQN